MTTSPRPARWRQWQERILPGRTTRSDAESVSSGIASYLAVCRRAVSDPARFAVFRRAPGYTPVLEHVSPHDGHEYHRLLRSGGLAVRHLAQAAQNDTIGGPALMRLESGLEISPTTLRYLKVADDLEARFGSLDGAEIVEIGAGYGGQCRVIDLLWSVHSYTLVDLRPVVNLAEEYLSHFALRTAVKFTTMNELSPRRYDLAISNYAFSELSRKLQEIYFAKVLDHARRGYITFNSINPAEYQSCGLAELCRRLDGQSRPEQPLTHPDNRIVEWDRRS